MKSEESQWQWLCKSICCILMATFLGGCAFSRTNVQVALSPDVKQPLEKSIKASVEIGGVQDSRLVTDKFVLLQKANAYGATSGAYVVDRPVADIFRGALTDTLKANGFVSGNTNRYVLSTEIHSFGFGVIQNFFSAATVKPFLVVRFELMDKATGRRIWNDTYTGEETVKASWETKDFISLEFSKVSEDVLKQLVSDKYFRNYFQE